MAPKKSKITLTTACIYSILDVLLEANDPLIKGIYVTSTFIKVGDAYILANSNVGDKVLKIDRKGFENDVEVFIAELLGTPVNALDTMSFAVKVSRKKIKPLPNYMYEAPPKGAQCYSMDVSLGDYMYLVGKDAKEPSNTPEFCDSVELPVALQGTYYAGCIPYVACVSYFEEFSPKKKKITDKVNDGERVLVVKSLTTWGVRVVCSVKDLKPSQIT